MAVTQSSISILLFPTHHKEFFKDWIKIWERLRKICRQIQTKISKKEEEPYYQTPSSLLAKCNSEILEIDPTAEPDIPVQEKPWHREGPSFAAEDSTGNLEMFNGVFL